MAETFWPSERLFATNLSVDILCKVVLVIICINERKNSS